MNDEQLDEKTRNARKLKRNILIVFGAMIVFIIIAVPLLKLLNGGRSEDDPQERKTYAPAQAFFEEPDFDLDILKDKEYLSLNRQVMVENSMTGVTEVMDEKNRYAFGEETAVIYDMINLIIRGDYEGYDALFTKEYRKSNPESEPFTMQQLYDIHIMKMPGETITEKGNSYKAYVFRVDYKINKNNGTFRTDIGERESRTQVIVVVEQGGKMLINSIS